MSLIFIFTCGGGILGVTSVTSVTNANFTAGLYVFYFLKKYVKYNKNIYIYGLLAVWFAYGWACEIL